MWGGGLEWFGDGRWCCREVGGQGAEAGKEDEDVKEVDLEECLVGRRKAAL